MSDAIDSFVAPEPVLVIVGRDSKLLHEVERVLAEAPGRNCVVPI